MAKHSPNLQRLKLHEIISTLLTTAVLPSLRYFSFFGIVIKDQSSSKVLLCIPILSLVFDFLITIHSMADPFLFSIAGSLIAKLASPAYEAASQLIGVYNDLQEFKETLRLVKAVLLDAEQKQEHNHELREWLRQIKQVFSDAQNVLDEFEYETLRKQVVKAYGTTKNKLVTLPDWLQVSANTLHSLIIEDCVTLEVLPEWLSTVVLNYVENASCMLESIGPKYLTSN